MMHVAMYLVLSTQLAVGTHVWVRRTKFSLNFRSGRSQPEVVGQCRTFCGSTSNFFRPLHRTFRRKRSSSTPFESLWRMTPSCSSKFSASCTKVRLQTCDLRYAIWAYFSRCSFLFVKVIFIIFLKGFIRFLRISSCCEHWSNFPSSWRKKSLFQIWNIGSCCRRPESSPTMKCLISGPCLFVGAWGQVVGGLKARELTPAQWKHDLFIPFCAYY